MLWTCTCVYHDLVFMYWLYTGPVNMKTCVLTYISGTYMLFHPSLSPSHHLLNWSLIGAVNDILSSPPDLQTGNPEITKKASWETYTFLIFRRPNIIHLLKWIKYDRIAFRSFCPVSLNWWYLKRLYIKGLYTWGQSQGVDHKRRSNI